MTKRSKPRHLRHRAYRGPASIAARVPPGELVLEFFTDQQLLQWRAQGKDYQSYHYLWYYELEAQRAANQAALLESLSKVSGCNVDLSGWGRALQYRYSDTPLSCLGSMKWLGCNPPNNATCCELNAETYRSLESGSAGAGP